MKKNCNIPKSLSFGLTVAAVIIGFIAYPLLPPAVATHWNAAGIADGYGPSWFGAFVFPALMALVLLLWVVIPKLVVFKSNFESFDKQYWILGATMQVYFMLFFGMTIAPNFGYMFDFAKAVIVTIGLLFIVIGGLMPSFKRNFFVGIRTPWTLSSDTVWEKTHEFGGKLFIAAGIISIASILLPGVSVFVAVIAVLAASLAAVGYSFIIFKKEGTAKKKTK